MLYNLEDLFQSLLRTQLQLHFQQSLCNTIQYDSVYLTCSKKLTGSQLSLPHEKKIK